MQLIMCRLSQGVEVLWVSVTFLVSKVPLFAYPCHHFRRHLAIIGIQQVNKPPCVNINMDPSG